MVEKIIGIALRLNRVTYWGGISATHDGMRNKLRPHVDLTEATEGFVTSEDRFVDRSEAAYLITAGGDYES